MPQATTLRRFANLGSPEVAADQVAPRIGNSIRSSLTRISMEVGTRFLHHVLGSQSGQPPIGGSPIPRESTKTGKGTSASECHFTLASGLPALDGHSR